MIRRFKDDDTASTAEDFLKLDGTAYEIAFHPQFAKNGYIYVGWSGANPVTKSWQEENAAR